MSDHRILKRSVDLGNHEEKIVYVVQFHSFNPMYINQWNWLDLPDQFDTLPDAIRHKEKLELKDGVVVG